MRATSAVRSSPVFRETVTLRAGLRAGGTEPRGSRGSRGGDRRAYLFGVGSGLIRPSGWTSVAGDSPDQLSDEEALVRWRDGVLAVCAAETPPGAGDGVLLLVLAVLGVLAGKTGARPADRRFWAEVEEEAYVVAAEYGVPGKDVTRARRQYDTPRWRGGGSPGLIELLAYFGLVRGDLKSPRRTDLGRAARDLLPDGLPRAADPDLDPADLLALAAPYSCGDTADQDTMNRIAAEWLLARSGKDAARELLAAADGLPATARLAARSLAREYPEPGGDRGLVDYLAAFLEADGADEVVTTIWRALPAETLEEGVALVAETGHPDADTVVAAVREFLASGAPRAIDQVLRLRITLLDTAEETWREMLIPATATLSDVHETAMILFGRTAGGRYVMDDDSPYWFGVGDRRYGAENGLGGGRVGLWKALDPGQIRIGSALGRTGSISYVHDPDACWNHEISLAETLSREDSMQYPVCVGFAGGNPPQLPGPGLQPEPFDPDAVNRELAEYRNQRSEISAALGEPDHW